MSKWSDDEINKCIILVKEGNSYKDISKIIQRSEGSIRNKLNEYGLKSSDYQYLFYYESKDCKHTLCDKSFKSLKSDKQQFCSKSCSTSFNNKIKTNKDKSKCLHCNTELNIKKKYCNNKCQASYETNIIFKEIEGGRNDLYVSNYRRYLINKYGAKCIKCNWGEINESTGKVPIQLDHIDGDHKNNKLENLRLLCPNCHSLTPNYGFLNKGKGRSERQRYRESLKKLSLEEILEEYKKVS